MTIVWLRLKKKSFENIHINLEEVLSFDSTFFV